MLKLVQSFPGTMQSNTLIALIQKFNTIALYDNHVPSAHRSAALKLAEALTTDLEKVLADKPEAIAALRHANDAMVEMARKGGYGSLRWKLEEDLIEGKDYIPYAMKPEHRHLVPDFLEILGPESVAGMKHHLVRQLIWQSDYSSNNAVAILHGVATKGDKAAAAIFTPEEYRALLGVPDDYAAGRRVLVGIGLLPAESGARAFKSMPEIPGVVRLMLKERKEESENDARVSGVDEDKRHALLLALTFLRVELARAQLRQIFGEDTATDMLSSFKDQAVRDELDRFKRVTEALRTLKPGTPVDFALLDW